MAEMIEDDFLRSILARPSEADATWLVLADWLEEHDDSRHELVRLLFDSNYRPDLTDLQRDSKVRELLLGGMKPVVPQLANSLDMTFSLIPSGRFLMGSPLAELHRNSDEFPHLVEITRPYLMGVHPVTQGQYVAVTATNPSYFIHIEGLTHDENLRLPVDSITWSDAWDFCERLSDKKEEKRAGRKYRLPTEAEWENACRGGARLSSPFSFGNAISSMLANFQGESPYGNATKSPRLDRPSVVGRYPPNAYGLFDMHGNTWEWVDDWYEDYDESGVLQIDPKGPKMGERRVLRGGAWHLDGQSCRSA